MGRPPVDCLRDAFEVRRLPLKPCEETVNCVLSRLLLYDRPMTARSPSATSDRGSAALVTIDRPERRNAVDGATAEALHECFERFEADDDARVMVLTGAGERGFLRGRRPEGDRDARPARARRPAGLHPPHARRSRRSPRSTGWCLAGGFELALWCDLRIATEGSTFGFFERRWGVPLIDGGTQRLPRIVGMGRALELILTGRPVEAEEAHRIGLVERGRGARQARRARPRAGRAARRASRRRRCSPTAAPRSRAAASTLSAGLALELQLGGPMSLARRPGRRPLRRRRGPRRRRHLGT